MQKEINFWITSDWHLNHSNIIKYCGRPENYEELLYENLKKVLKPEDVLICLGDISLGREIYYHKTFVQALPGKKWLIKGNHDNKHDSFYLTHGWGFVCQSFLIKRYGKKIIFSHKPMNGDYDFNVHAHQHNNIEKVGDCYPTNGKLILVSQELIGYKPVLLRKLLKL